MTVIYFAGQDQFGNRGCEALIRSNVKIIKERMPATTFLVPSRNQALDAAQWPTFCDLGAKFIRNEPIPDSIRWWSRIKRFVWKGLESKRPTFSLTPSTREAIDSCDVLIMTGGDIISLDYGLESLYFWTQVCEYAMEAGKKTVLWAGSIGPFSKIPSAEYHMKEFIRRFDLITVRESSTAAYLEELGVNNAKLVADPAFCLDVETSSHGVGQFFESGHILGFNVSPVIRKFRGSSSSKKMLDEEVVSFLCHVIEKENFKVALIPHVDPLEGKWENSDSDYLQMIYNRMPLQLRESGKIEILPSTLNAAQLKYAISRCSLFMGGRTHATIAALSCHVPTTSISYSVKAKGINQDLFGHTHFVLETPDVSKDTLLLHFDRIRSSQDEIKHFLQTRIPAWSERARLSASYLEQMLAGES